MKATLCFVLGVLVGLFGAFIMRNTEVGPPEISDGHYRIYVMQKAYDTATGEPIYWLIADSVKWGKLGSNNVSIHEKKIRFYKIPRRAIINLPFELPHGKSGPVASFLLSVKEGRGTIDDVRFGQPPTVITH